MKPKIGDIDRDTRENREGTVYALIETPKNNRYQELSITIPKFWIIKTAKLKNAILSYVYENNDNDHVIFWGNFRSKSVNLE